MFKKCFSCNLNTGCECFQYYLEGVTESTIKEVSCSNKKYRTIIEGNFDLKVAVFLKKRLGCGGSYFNDRIELQGKHKDKLLSELDK
jgi:translation initiation factor 1 (eIF-1/SUI1)